MGSEEVNQEEPIFVHESGFRNRPARVFVFEFYQDRLVASLRNRKSDKVIDYKISYYLPWKSPLESFFDMAELARDTAGYLKAPEDKYNLPKFEDAVLSLVQECEKRIEERKDELIDLFLSPRLATLSLIGK